MSEDLSTLPTVPNVDFAFSTTAGVLGDMLGRVNAVVPTGHVFEVLKNVRFDVDEALRLVGTNTDLAAFVTTTDVEVSRCGTGVLPGKRLVEVVSLAEPDAEFAVDVKDGIAHLRAGRATCELRVPDGSLFPRLPDADVLTYEVPREPFADGIKLVRSTMSTDSIRPQLQMVDVVNGVLQTSDGVRYQQVRLKGWPDIALQVPAAAVDVLLGLLRSTEAETIEVGEATDYFVFGIEGERFITTRLVEPFPPLIVERLLRPALANRDYLAVDRLAFLNAIRWARTQADQETSTVVLTLTSTMMRVRARDRYQNTASAEVDVDWRGVDREVAFKHQHLSDLLRSVRVQTCEFLFGPDKKTVRHPVVLMLDDPEFVAVISQVRADL